MLPLLVGPARNTRGDSGRRGGHVTGKEPIDKIFIQSGCTACHTIPGIRVAMGREGPKRELGTTARRRLADLSYRGQACMGAPISVAVHPLPNKLTQ